MQKIIYCNPISEDEPLIDFSNVNEYLKDGWKIMNVVAQHCAATGKGQSYDVKNVFGGFVIVIEKC